MLISWVNYSAATDERASAVAAATILSTGLRGGGDGDPAETRTPKDVGYDLLSYEFEPRCII